ncbi:hypothetical protein N8996_01805 [Candidatus Poseidonia alphae]|nr:hypothetical protein [Candidatus Poseidonia alphae]
MADTTNLSDLPSDPTGGGGGNIVLDTSEKPTQYTPNVESSQTDLNQIDQQKMMNEIVTGIQQANANGATALPSRDIPQSTVHFADEATQPNFVPSLPEQKDYIQNNDSEHEILARRIKNQNTKDSLEILYDEFQIPIIIGLLFFIFQLPVVRSKFLSILPSLHNLDGNPNLTGYILTSIFFGICYYVISKSLTHMQTI